MKTWKSLLVLLLLSGNAWGTNYIERTDSGGAHEAYYTSLGDLATALGECSDGDKVILLNNYNDAGDVYTLSSDTAVDFLTGASKKSVTIETTGGFTWKVLDCDLANNTITLPTGLSIVAGTTTARIFGSGVGNLDERYKYYIKSYNSTTGIAEMSASAGTGAATKTLTANNLATRPCYLYSHAFIQPATMASQTYDKFLQLKNGNNITIKNVTFEMNAPLYVGQTGKNSNGTSKAGIVLEIYQPDGVVTLTGVQVRDCTGSYTTPVDTSFGINVWGTASGVQPNQLVMTNCFTDNTDYAGLRVGDVYDVSIADCAFLNWRQRAIAERTEGNGRCDTFSISDCFLYCENTNYTAGDEGSTGSSTTGRLRCAINHNPTYDEAVVNLTDTVIDIRNCEGSGYSWNFYEAGPTSCPLVKFQNADYLYATDCKFLHNGNKASTANQQFSVKFDPATGCDNVTFRRCEFSGGILCSPNNTQDNYLKFFGCKIMKDGNFKVTDAVTFCEYKIVEFGKDGSTRTTVDNLSSAGLSGNNNASLVKYYDTTYNSLGATRSLTIKDTDITATGTTTLDAYLTRGHGGTTHGANSTDTGVTFDGGTCDIHNDHGGFKFSLNETGVDVEEP